MKLQDLADAIYSRYADSAEGASVRLLTATTKSMFPRRAPQDSVVPYITYQFISSTHNWTMVSDLDSPLIQFSVWDNQRAPDRCLQIMDALTTLYKDVLFTLTDSSPVRADIVGVRLVPDMDIGWQGIVECQYLFDTER